MSTLWLHYLVNPKYNPPQRKCTFVHCRHGKLLGVDIYWDIHRWRILVRRCK